VQTNRASPGPAPADTSVPSSPIEIEVHRIRGFLEHGEFAQALAAALALRSRVPENRDVLYMIAVSLRYLKRIPEALVVLAELEQHYPNHSRLFQERGHCFVAMRSAEPAINSFLRAVTLNPSLQASWSTLQALFRMNGRQVDAENAGREAAKLANLPKEILAAFNMFADGEIAAAEHVVRQYLLIHGNHIEGMRLLARIGIKFDVVDDAEILLENVLALAPDYHAARYEYALALLNRHKHARAKKEMEKRRRRSDHGTVKRTGALRI
jgi:predicted Zn-dependent protease